jgi:hypothetical protein
MIIDAEDLIGPGTTLSRGTLVADLDLDLTAVGNERIADIGRIDLTSGTSNSLTLNLDDVLALVIDPALENDVLRIEGDGAADTGGAPDAANLVGAWTVSGASGGSPTTSLETVSVEADVTVAIGVTVLARARTTARYRSADPVQGAIPSEP